MTEALNITPEGQSSIENIIKIKSFDELAKDAEYLKVESVPFFRTYSKNLGDEGQIALTVQDEKYDRQEERYGVTLSYKDSETQTWSLEEACEAAGIDINLPFEKKGFGFLKQELKDKGYQAFADIIDKFEKSEFLTNQLELLKNKYEERQKINEDIQKIFKDIITPTAIELLPDYEIEDTYTSNRVVYCHEPVKVYNEKIKKVQKSVKIIKVEVGDESIKVSYGKRKVKQELDQNTTIDFNSLQASDFLVHPPDESMPDDEIWSGWPYKREDKDNTKSVFIEALNYLLKYREVNNKAKKKTS